MAARGRPEWQQRLKLPIIVAVSFLAVGILVYQFYNYRAEGAVKDFLEDVFNGRHDRRWIPDNSRTALVPLI